MSNTHPTFQDRINQLHADIEMARAIGDWDKVATKAINMKATIKQAEHWGYNADHQQAMIGHRVIR